MKTISSRACPRLYSLAWLTIAGAASLLGQVDVIATGLQGSQKFLLTPRGSFLVSETNTQPSSGRISIVSRTGTRRSLFESLPSGAEVTGGGSGPTGLALANSRTLYAAIGAGDSERRNAAGASIHNPTGISSNLFGSILEVRFSNDIDALTGTFRLTTALENQIADGETVEVSDGAGATARISLLVAFPRTIKEGTGYRFSNVWSLALSEDGATLWVIDASMNTLSRVATATGRYQTVMRFDPLPNVGPIGPPVVDSVPTGLRVYGDQVLVSFLTGFPFTAGYARVLAVDPVARRAEPFIFGLTSAVDVLWRTRGAAPTQFFTLEFSLNQTATPAGPGRLMRFDTSTPQVVASDLRGPVQLAFDPATEELFILEVSGRILRVSAR